MKKYQKDMKFFELKYKENNAIINIFSYIYEKYGDNTKNENIINLSSEYDSNKNRFSKMLKIFWYIKNKTKLMNKKILFLYNTFELIGKKDNLDDIFKFLENKLFNIISNENIFINDVSTISDKKTIIKNNTFSNLDINNIKEFVPKNNNINIVNQEYNINKCIFIYKNKKCTSNLKGKYKDYKICKFHLENFCKNCKLHLNKCKCSS